MLIGGNAADYKFPEENFTIFHEYFLQIYEILFIHLFKIILFMKNNWIEILGEESLPENSHFLDHTQYWMSCNGIVFKGYFYNSYGGKNYSLDEVSDAFFEMMDFLLENKVDSLGFFKKIDAYMELCEDKPEPFQKKSP